MAKMERRQRQQRRQEAEMVEVETEKERAAEGFLSSSRRIEETLSVVSAAQSLTEVSSSLSRVSISMPLSVSNSIRAALVTCYTVCPSCTPRSLFLLLVCPLLLMMICPSLPLL